MRFMDILLVSVVALLAFHVLLYAALETGPNCPGKDPAWLGWCEEAPE